MGKRSVYNFNHTADLPTDQIQALRRLYSYYHRLSVCYGQAYKRSKRLEVSLKVTSTFLTVAGAAMIPLSLVTLAVSGLGVCIRVYSDARDIQSKVEKYRLAHTSYLKVLDDLRSHLRGLPYDDKVLISDLRVLDQMINDIPSIPERLLTKYKKTYIDNCEVTDR